MSSYRQLALLVLVQLLGLANVYGKYVDTFCEARLRTDAGWVCGRIREAEDGSHYASFRGVPYAKPPLWERRFMELEPPEPWTHDWDATEESPACPQKDAVYSRIPLNINGMSEDCIYANIHIPKEALEITNNTTVIRRGSRLPVVVNVHGGAFISGSGFSDLHGPEYFMTKPVIVVTFNVRIGLFGYLSLASKKIPGNQALRDVITLLRWVQRNAREFGGNPGDVTLLGHSTGGILAHLSSLSKAAIGLIHKVILMSGTGVSYCVDTSPIHAAKVARDFVRVLGINSTDPDVIHDQLVREPLVNLMEAFTYTAFDFGSDLSLLKYGPIVESWFPGVTQVVDEDPFTLVAKGRAKNYPLLVGFTTAEVNYFKWALYGANTLERIKTKSYLFLSGRLRREFSDRQIELGDEIKNKFLTETSDLEDVIDIFSNSLFVYPAIKVAEWRAMLGAPVYLYQFSFEPERSLIKEASWANFHGVAHVEDLTYLYRANTLMHARRAHPPANKDDHMRLWFTKVITNFIQCNNPTCTKHETAWPPMSTARIQYQDFARPEYQMRNLTTTQSDMMEFFDSIDKEYIMVGEKLKRISENL